jgi:hypothetical protein
VAPDHENEPPRPIEVVDAETANDVGVWGSKSLSNADYDRPLVIGGEPIDLDSLPAFGDESTIAAEDGKPQPRVESREQ